MPLFHLVKFHSLLDSFFNGQLTKICKNRELHVMNPHVPTPRFSQGQLVASLAGSLPCPVPPLHPTPCPIPWYSKADPRSQISSSVNISLLSLFSHEVLSSSFPLHGLQQARPPCPSPSPGACSNSCPPSR